jgi:hypothetical protein
MSNFQHVCKIVQIVAGLEAEQTNVFLQASIYVAIPFTKLLLCHWWVFE